MSNVFKDKKLQKEFELKGFVVIPFLSEEEVEMLKQQYSDQVKETPEGFYSTSFSKDEAVKNNLINGVDELFDEKTNGLFQSIKKLGSCYLNKSPGPQGEMPIHQDWTVVNEPEFDSITIWVPLCDVDENNGAMQVLEGSHRFGDALRSPSLTNPFLNVQNEIRNDLKTISMKAGQAMIFSQALLHASPPNKSSENRLVVTYGLIPSEAQLLFYHKNEYGLVEKYEVNTDFFQKYNTQIGQKPTEGKIIEQINYKESLVTKQDYQKMKNAYLARKAETMYKMIPLFKDAERQDFFEREGYIVFPLLDESEVNDLKSYYESLQLKDEKGFGFHVSMDSSDKEMCRRTREKVWSVALPKLGEHLKNFKPFVASFVVKEINPKGVVPAHQDWSFVDKEEEGYSSITCWITLVDTTLDNGEMGVIRGSHKFMQNARPSPSPQTPVPLSEHMFSIFPYLHTIDMKAGEVLMFDNRTFHASPPNTSDGIRLAAGVGVTQKDAQLVHFYMKPDGEFKTMLRYNVDEDFYLKYENATLAKMFDEKKLIEGYGEPVEVPYEFTKYTTDELVEIIKGAGNTYNIPMTEKLAKLFGYMNNERKTEEPKPEPIQQEEKSESPVLAEEWVDNRTFFQKYTPLNIAREIKNKLVGAE